MNGLNIASVVSNDDPKSLEIIFGRFMLPDMSEHACQVVDLTSTGATFLTENAPAKGLALVAYLEEVGRVEAISREPVAGGFAVAFSLTGSRLERLQQRIQWLQQKQAGAAPRDAVTCAMNRQKHNRIFRSPMAGSIPAK